MSHMSSVYLTWVTLAGKVEVHALTTTEVVVGREPDSDIVLDSPYISRHHARFIRQGGEGRSYSVADLRSTGGMYVNGRRMERTEFRAGIGSASAEAASSFVSLLRQQTLPSLRQDADSHNRRDSSMKLLLKVLRGDGCGSRTCSIADSSAPRRARGRSSPDRSDRREQRR